MHAKFGSRLFLCVAIGLFVPTNEARADFAQCANPLPDCTTTSTGCCKTAFPAVSTTKALVIPMDRCHQTLAGTSSVNGAPGSLAPRRELSISSISRTGSTVTVTTSATHGLSSDNYVRIAGVSDATFNGTWSVKTGNTCTFSPSANCTTSQFQYTTTTSGTIAAISNSGKALAHNYGNGWCVDAPGTDTTRIGGNVSDNGIFRAYGLVYRLMQRAIPIYWMVNPSKTPPAVTSSENASSQSLIASDVDAWVVTSDITDPPSSGADLTDCLTGSGCTQPVHRLKSADLTPYADSYRKKEFPLRGGSFLIAPENRAAFDAFWLRTGTYAALASETKYAWTTSGIDLYELDASAKIVHQNFAVGDGTSTSKWTTIVGAPVAVKIDYEPPRVGCLGCSSAVAQNWLATAGLADPAATASCASGEFVPSDATYCLLNDTDVAQGTLVSGGFGWMWMFGYNDNSPCGNSAEKAVFDKVRDFMTTIPAIRNAGHSIFLDDSVKVAEGCPGKQLMGFAQTTTDGLEIQNAGNSEPYILRYPANLFMQFGDIPIGIASGALAGWKYYKSGSTTIGYQTALQASGSSLRRLVSIDTTGTNNTACVQHTSSTSCDSFTPSAATGDIMDVLAYARHTNNLNNGLAFYLPGQQLDNSGNVSELRILLNSLIALPDESFNTTPAEIEVARSSPIVATVAAATAVYQGTFVRQDPAPSVPKATTASGLARFTFPYLKGHMRAIPTSSFTACSGMTCSSANSNRTAINALASPIFDAANNIPTATAAGCSANFNGSCRTVFTNVARGRLPTRTMFTSTEVSNATSTLGALIGSNLTTTERATLVSRVLAGVWNGSGWISKLGGVDRSTPAVIGPSPLAGSAGRPTMVYFGATDGMMHAVCASTGGGCDVVGRELWAFIPRTLLTELRKSTARVDGSPHVIDAYGNWDNDATTPDSFATVLIFHTGTGVMTNNNVVPAVFAIDVTAPNNPKILWEYSVANVGARDTYDLGVGLNIVGGTALIGTVQTPVTIVQTNNGGTGGAASVVTVINTVTGAEIWQQGDIYPTSSGKSARSSIHEGAPSSGIPGGAVGIDKTGNGFITHIVYGTLYGDVFVRALDATGTPQNGTTSGAANPLFRMSVDYKPIGVPPAIYQIGTTQYAAFVTGGYADSQATLWRGENESTVPTQLAFAVSLSYTTATALTELTSDVTKVPFTQNLGSGEGGFAQAIVVGGELFIVTDKTNVNSYDYGTSSAPTGKVYRYDFAAATPSFGTTTVIAGGAGSLFNNGQQLFSASGQYGERTTTDAAGTTGTSVDPIGGSMTTLTRHLWLRTE